MEAYSWKGTMGHVVGGTLSTGGALVNARSSKSNRGRRRVSLRRKRQSSACSTAGPLRLRSRCPRLAPACAATAISANGSHVPSQLPNMA